MNAHLKTGRFAVLAGIFMALAAVAASAQDKTYNLAVKYTVGDLLTYKMQMNTNMELKTPDGNPGPLPAMEMVMSTTTRMKTAGIKPDGTAVITTRNEKGEMTMMGNTVPIPKTPDVTLEIDKRGVGKMRGLEKIEGAQVLSQFMNMNQLPTTGAVLPDHPVKIGDSWETEIPSPMGGTVKFTSTLLGVEQVGGQETLKIKQVMTMPMNFKIGPDTKPTTDEDKAMLIMKGDYIMNGLVNILEENGRLIKMAADIKGDITMEMKGDAAQQSPFGDKMNMKLDGKMSMNLLSADKVTAPAPVPPNKKPNKKG